MGADSWNRVEISLPSLRKNYDAIRRHLGEGVEVLAMIKSEAYGHGLIKIAETLYAAGAGNFGVAEVEEGVRLRRAGIQGDIIVVLGADVEAVDEILEYDLSPVVYHLPTVKKIAEVATGKNRNINIHLKVDVGMGRLGIVPEKIPVFLQEVAQMTGVSLRGILSHFPLADAPDTAPTSEQFAHFADILALAEDVLGEKKIFHIANSAALIRFPKMHLDMVRPGIALYGCFPSAQMKTDKTIDLHPVMTFKTNVIQVKEVPAGYGISYGHTFHTARPSRLAILPVGYADGYLRKLSNRAQVLIAGRRFPVVGRVCMNATIIDVTDGRDIASGDEVVLMGRQEEEEISADEVAGWLDTISYEVLCLFGSSNRRVYIA